MFQFTHPGKGATAQSRINLNVSKVSIHAPWEGCDFGIEIPYGRRSGFQFTHPGKGATRYSKLSDDRIKFQFTHPGKGATGSGDDLGDINLFQFTHPGKGATQLVLSVLSMRLSFNSRTLGRVRLRAFVLSVPASVVSIHAPWEGCDLPGLFVLSTLLSFNSRTLGRVRPATA